MFNANNLPDSVNPTFRDANLVNQTSLKIMVNKK